MLNIEKSCIQHRTNMYFILLNSIIDNIRNIYNLRYYHEYNLALI